MTMLDYAKSELDLIGMTEDSEDEMNRAMRKHILHMVNEFAEEGHSGFSASYALNILKYLLSFKPLAPLTGADNEWNEVGEGHWQNRRAPDVFKDKDGAYWTDGLVFWEWYTDKETGEKFKSYFTNKESRVKIESFPWVMPEKPEYREWIEK